MKTKHISLVVDETGSVFLGGTLVLPSYRKSGYSYVSFAVHRMMCLAFNGPPPSDGKKYVVDHIDGNGANNHPDNLRWLTHAENVRHRPRKPKLSEGQVVSILGLRPKSVMTQKELAAKFHVSIATVTAVRTGKLGTSNNTLRKLTPEAIEAFRSWKGPEITASRVAKMFSVSSTTVRTIWATGGQ